MSKGGGGAFTAGTTGDLRKSLQAYRALAQTTFEQHRATLLRALNEQVLARTPVWEGDTIANWRWSVGAPTGEFVEPEDNGPPGSTGSMALGSEPRRSVNEQQSRESLEAAISESRGKMVDIWLENNSEGAVPLEYGQWPTPDRTRTPAGGIVRIAVRNIIAGFLEG